MMIDAMVGVAIIAMAIAVCLASLGVTRRASHRADTTRAAQMELTRLMAVTEAVPGLSQGIAGGFTYQVAVSDVPVGMVHLCEVDATVTSRDHHKFSLKGTRWCVDPSARAATP